MKKRATGAIALIIIAFAGIYMFIPGKLRISRYVLTGSTLDGANRVLPDKYGWHNWWPGKVTGTGRFEYNGHTYIIDAFLYNRIKISIQKDDVSLGSFISLFPISPDTLGIEWTGELVTSRNPFTRTMQYVQARKISYDMEHILEHLKRYLENDENIYGFRIEKVRNKDTFLIGTTAVTDTVPGVPAIYRMVESLCGYASSGGAKKLNYPILNISKGEKNRIITTVAIFTDKALKTTGPFEYMRLYDATVLVAEVKGGPYMINNAYRQIRNYLNDHNIVSPSKPFEELVTNRQLEPDTSRWVTRVYFTSFLRSAD
jgi:hypothetical protein